MPSALDRLGTFHPPDRAAWRAWLDAHHATSPGVWLVYNKKASGKSRVPYDETVEEALCFGWIDSLPRKLDAERSMLLFTPRKPGSVWARTNKARVERLIAEGLMRPAGLAKIEAAQADGSWDTLTAADAGLVPDDLAQSLAATPPAAERFGGFSASARAIILGWIAMAKRPETRAKRVAQTAEMAARGLRANLDRP